jgi:hypothetical protein
MLLTRRAVSSFISRLAVGSKCAVIALLLCWIMLSAGSAFARWSLNNAVLG